MIVGVPLPIIFVIAMMMSMFAFAAIVLYKKRHIFSSQNNIDKMPSHSYSEQEDQK